MQQPRTESSVPYSMRTSGDALPGDSLSDLAWNATIPGVIGNRQCVLQEPARRGVLWEKRAALESAQATLLQGAAVARRRHHRTDQLAESIGFHRLRDERLESSREDSSFVAGTGPCGERDRGRDAASFRG